MPRAAPYHGAAATTDVAAGRRMRAVSKAAQPSLQDTHAVQIWRILQGGVRVYICTPPCKTHTVHMWRISQGGLGVYRAPRVHKAALSRLAAEGGFDSQKLVEGGFAGNRAFPVDTPSILAIYP
jgi:hypothetical protein